MDNIFDSEGLFNYDPDDYPQGDFKSMIDKHNLTPEFEILEDEDGLLVTETWSSKDETFVANRYYYFDANCVDIIDDRIKTQILEHVLEIYVDAENYESAAIIRDILKK